MEPLAAESSICPECGASYAKGQTCRDYFHQMLFWENDDPARGEVHHLMVLCYHLQHPGLYSAEGLRYARQLLVDFVERGLSPEEARRRNRDRVNSGRRDWSITARPGNQGAYERSITWTMTAADVVAGGAEAYCENVRAWAESVSKNLKEG
jgi:hypothetical protein